MFVNQVLFGHENVDSDFVLLFGMLEYCSLHFNRKIAKSLTKQSNSGLQKPLKSSKFRIFSKVLTSSNFFVKFQCFHKKITKSMFFQQKTQLTLNINVRKKKK